MNRIAHRPPTTRWHARATLGACAAAAAAGLLATPAFAQSTYVGGSVGGPGYPGDVNGIAINTSGLSGKVFGGYTLTPWFSVEGGLAYLGHASSALGSVHSNSLFLDALGTLPLGNQFSLLGRLGLARVWMDTPAGNDAGWGPKFGLGAEYALSKSTAIRAEWERYRPDVFNSRPNLDQYTVGLRLSF
jgi:OOP family OmpA-OmpF porin